MKHTSTKTIAKAPGKLMIAGEWSVLTYGNPCVACAIDVYAEATIVPSKKWIIHAPDFGLYDIPFVFKEKALSHSGVYTGTLSFVQYAAVMSISFLTQMGIEVTPCELLVHTDFPHVLVQGTKEKVGFGSSAAVTVSVVASVLSHFSFDLTEGKNREIVLNLACVAHYLAQGSAGSGYDIATSTYGGLLAYTRFDALWLQENLTKMSIIELVNAEWPGLSVSKINVPNELIVLACFVGRHASTSQMLAAMNSFEKRSKRHYQSLMDSLALATEKVILSLSQNDQSALIQSISTYRDLLCELQMQSQVELETPELTLLCDGALEYGFAAKLSGAGGGDSGIAIGFEKKNVQKITEAWRKNKLYPQDVALSLEGVSIV